LVELAVQDLGWGCSQDIATKGVFFRREELIVAEWVVGGTQDEGIEKVGCVIRTTPIIGSGDTVITAATGYVS